MPVTSDPFTRERFLIEIAGINKITATSVEGLSATIEVTEERDGASVSPVARKLPGLQKYSNVTLKRGLTEDLSLWNWFSEIQHGNVDRRTVQVALLDATGNPVVGWQLTNAWPCRWSGPDLSTGSNEIAIETLEICYENLQMTAI